MIFLCARQLFTLTLFWSLAKISRGQNEEKALELGINSMKGELDDIKTAINAKPLLDTANYFDHSTVWELLPTDTYRTQLFECSLKSGFLAFQHILLDQIANNLPEKVFYSRVNTMSIINNFVEHEGDCAVWRKDKLTLSDSSCDDPLPAVCLTPVQLSRTDVTLHNMVTRLLLGEVDSFQTILDNAATIVAQGVPAESLFQESWFAGTLVKYGEALRGAKALIYEQDPPFQPPILGDLQRIKSQTSSLVQKVLIASLQAWSSLQKTIKDLPANTQSGIEQAGLYRKELDDVVLKLNRMQASLDEGAGGCSCQPVSPDTPAPASANTSPPSQAAEVFCAKVFETCETNIFPFEQLVSIKKLIKYSLVNFYAGVTWAVLMFIILVASGIYTYKQLSRLKGWVEQSVSPIARYREQQPLIDMNKLGRALNQQ